MIESMRSEFALRTETSTDGASHKTANGVEPNAVAIPHCYPLVPRPRQAEHSQDRDSHRCHVCHEQDRARSLGRFSNAGHYPSGDLLESLTSTDPDAVGPRLPQRVRIWEFS